MKKFILAILSGVSVTTAAAAESNWRIVSWNEEFVLYIDQSSIKSRRPATSYLSKILYLKDRSLSELVTKVEVNCAKSVYRSRIIWSVSGSKKAAAMRMMSAWRTLQPSSNAEREAGIACQR